ncbi:zinc finger protein without children isoform 2-T4 [Glossina fuscipes fuscipes]
MEEISSLDSFHTDGADSTARPESAFLKIDEETTQTSEYKDGEDNTSVAGDANREEGDGNDDEFEQISEGTFDVDENSQATSAGVPADDSNQEEGVGGGGDGDADADADADADGDGDGDGDGEGEGEGEGDVAGEVEEDEEDVNESSQVDDGVNVEAGKESRSFEEVDANVSANNNNQSGVDESDMLGEADNTLPQERPDSVAKDQVVTETLEENEGEGDDEDAMDTMDAMEQETDAVNQDADIQYYSNSSPPKESEQNAVNDNQDESTEPMDQGANEVDAEVEEDQVMGEETENTEKEAPVVATDSHSKSPDKEIAPVPSKDVSNDGGEPEQHEDEDEPVENVQEPEESDVCLIPDDTENEVTEAEKEQAILARENAEKEDAEQVASAPETAPPTATENQTTESQEERTTSDNAEAQATKQAGAEAEVATNQADPNNDDDQENNAGENADADEPLLEELHTSTTEAGNTTKIIIAWIVSITKSCKQCNQEKLCGFRFKNPDTTDFEYLCQQSCCEALISAHPGKYFIRRKKFLLDELSANEINQHQQIGGGQGSGEQFIPICMQCKESKSCKYFFKQDEETYYICNDDCFNLLNAEEPDKFKLKRHSIRVRNIGATTISGDVAKESTSESRVVTRSSEEVETARAERSASFVRRCSDCFEEIIMGDRNLIWETMDFCNEICLGKYQRTIGASCQTCQGEVPHNALGKYCVRFGFDIRQFCCAACLNEFKKGLKTCSCCQKDISGANEGFLAPVGDKEQFKDFCSQACMRRYDNMANPKKKLRNDICVVCNTDKPVRVEIILDEKELTFCSNPCFSAFKFVSKIVPDQCGMCCKYFERKANESFTIYAEKRAKVFCSRICLNVYIVVNRHIVSCQWCKVKKYNFDMIVKHQDNQDIIMCSLNCLTLYGVSINAFSRTVTKCDNCSTMATPQYHLTMSDASMRNFCNYTCVMQFQSQFARAPLTLENEAQSASVANQQTQQSAQKSAKNAAPFPTGLPKRVKLKVNQQPQLKISNKTGANNKKGPTMPVISTVSSLASGETETMIGNVTVRRTRIRSRKMDSPPPPPTSLQANNMSAALVRGRPRKSTIIDRTPTPSPPRTVNKRSNNMMEKAVLEKAETKIVVVPPYPPAVRNVQTSCKPQTMTVGFQCEPKTITVGTQTDKDYSNKVLIPVPVPIYVPQPMYMYSAPFPVPVPIPLPIPVPIFIPTTRNSAQGIMKEIKKIQDKMPADPFEAELLMMAEMVAEEKRESDSDSEDEVKPDPAVVSLQYNNSVQQVDVTNNSYGEDVLQMALKMATGDYDQPTHTVDLESAMTANTITNPPPGMVQHDDTMSHMSGHHMQHHMMDQRGSRGRKRGSVTSPVSPRNSRSPVKRQRLQEMEPTAQPAAQPIQPAEKPDANMCLKYTFGVNAWKQWVMTKNADIEKSSMRRRTFKTELLQMTADELNYSLCLFVKEVRKPNGTEYAPDTIYYLVLGIQQYLYENGRIDNIFTDPYYEQFTDCLDEVARKFSVLYNDSQYIVTRVEEEHLWECKQLGAHSPHVLLSTLMFFNTKHFNLTVEEHMQLSFSHIMKHWKRNAQNSKAPGNRNVLLRFYPPQAGLEANPRKKKVYEQQENEDNPLRCPVRLYEFYLSKCPESVKTRNDVFYLQPERSCVPDSPVWYSTQPLSKEALQKMLHRVKMVKEINIALLTS